MWIFNFYRILISLSCGVAAYLLINNSLLLLFLSAFTTRLIWFFTERIFDKINVNRNFSRHISQFKQEMGPYGIRLANKAENNRSLKKSLSEVFSPDIKKVEKTVEQLEVMDTLFRAGMNPRGDDYLLHDLKLKYGKIRLKNR